MCERRRRWPLLCLAKHAQERRPNPHRRLLPQMRLSAPVRPHNLQGGQPAIGQIVTLTANLRDSAQKARKAELPTRRFQRGASGQAVLRRPTRRGSDRIARRKTNPGSLRMSDRPQGEAWWLASDGKWYPPESHPSAQQPAASTPPVEPPWTNAPTSADPRRSPR